MISCTYCIVTATLEIRVRTKTGVEVRYACPSKVCIDKAMAHVGVLKVSGIQAETNYRTLG